MNVFDNNVIFLFTAYCKPGAFLRPVGLRGTWMYLTVVSCFYLQLIVNLVLLYAQLGYAALIGASVFVVISPIQFKVAALIGKQQKKLLVSIVRINVFIL